MYSIFHEDSYNEHESTEDSVPNASIDDEACTLNNNAHYSSIRESSQQKCSSEFPLQQSSNYFRLYDSGNCGWLEDSVYSEEEEDSESSKNEIYISQSHSHKTYQEEKPHYSAFGTSIENCDFLTFREKTNSIVNNCLSAILEKIEQIKCMSENSEDNHLLKFKDRIDNLHNQQKEYENFTSAVQAQFSLTNTENQNFQKAIGNLRRESVIFKQFFPAYAYRQEILNAIEKNQVVIISASQIYSTNVALPLIFSNVYKKYSVIACEPNEILSLILEQKIKSVVTNYGTESLDTQVCVLPENELLNECLFTTRFAGNNCCIIFNVPLKRSVTTDISLLYLKDLLFAQKHSKLILLLSPQDNAIKFAEYFSSKIAVSVLKFRDLFLPIKTVWKNAVSYPQDNFIDDLVKTIFSIHAAYREPGDIIAFLPCLEDVQSAFDKLELENNHYHYNDLKVICIDDLELILKSALYLNNTSERRVFLLVSNYEGLSIPSVRFVIDCGVQKESYFDKKTDTNIIIPLFISQARAKMRKYMAGAHKTGVCFRLFNKANYFKNMPSKEYAEIFCINPVHSIVMTLQLCPQNRNSIHFVESLPTDVLQSTLSSLKVYGIIDKNLSLTSVAESIIKLPLPIKYSRFIVHGIQSGFAFEAIVLVAFFSIKSGLFVEAADDKHQRLIDLMKMDFMQSNNSDTLTYINMYKLWGKNGFRKSWCIEHFLNFDTLKKIRCKINDIVHLVPEYLDQEVVQQFSEDIDSKSLIQMLMECFQDNLCTYTGHPRTGYRILSSGKYAMIHSSSLLSQKNDFPDFVIFEDLISSDANYIKHLTSVPFKMIADFYEQNKMNFDSSALYDYKLEKKTIDGVGDKVISRFLPKNDKKKIEEVENKLKKEANTSVVLIEPVLERGIVHLYAFQDDIDKCFTSLQHILNEYVQIMTSKEENKVIEYSYGPNKVFFETKWIKGAETISTKYILNKTRNLAAEHSATAVDNISESSNASSIKYTLKISWPRLVCTGEVYLKFKNHRDFHRARKLTLKKVKVGDYEVWVELSNEAKNQLLVSDIPSIVTKKDIENTFSSLLPGCQFEVELRYTCPFETNENNLKEMKRQIEENCIHFSNITNFEVRVLKPDPDSECMTAYIDVFEERCLNKEAENLSETVVNGMKLKCEPLYFSEHKCSPDVFNTVRYCIKEELDIFLEKNQVSYKKYCLKIIVGKDSVTIKLSSDDIQVMKLVQMHINHLLNGIRLDASNVKDIHKLFCHGGHIFLKALGATEKVHVVINSEGKFIRLFGPQEKINCVRQCILNFLKDSENEVGKNFVLSNEKQNRLILKTLINEYGANLEKFIELCKLRSAALNLKTSCLSVYGTKDSVQKAEQCIKELSSNVGFDNVTSDSSSEELCPVCFMPPESLSFRLQHCGHLYCSDCIKGLIDQAEFPLQCCAENCSKPITLGDIKYIVNDDVIKINELADKSLKAYLDKNRDKIFYCPAADCSMFLYKNEITVNKWNCPLCKNNICISCNVVYHEGYTCDIYRGSKEDPDYSFKVWQKSADNCKHCPRCKTAIQKTQGCNHMTCRSCNAHFCWLCVTEFPSGNAVYAHLGTCRGAQ